MSERETIEIAETIILNYETAYLTGLFKKIEIAQNELNGVQEDKLINKVCKEKKRLDPKDKYDEEEVIIAQMVRSVR